ncbi:hypothetical protein [Pseudomonas typographi]|uniref:hypothetical protein n=1 Tax=Pseudomonas typographi TaxID=2715964 RepID=UPI001689E8B4|nr:hypothetical protein [Pseudomonas typographi]MBD1554256.1 hypothetical protein [Pseudomonas typographi]
MSTEWKLVPVEPTDEMIEAAGEAYEFDAEAEDELGFNIAVTNTAAVYRAMIAAAPQPPAGREPEVRGYVVAGSMFFLERLRAEQMTRGGKYELVEVIDRDAYTALAAERDALQSELTKVRELLGRAREYGGLTPPWREAVSDLLAHQSAPARR